MAEDFKKYEYDVIVIGAGGAGLRAAIEAARSGAKTAIITKSLLGKAHTVMAEGGCAAALQNADPRDGWKVHFHDTMKGSKWLANWQMAEYHAKEAPDRVRELEQWGAVFDRTNKNLINQRNFGGHTFPRLAHVGDATGLEIIRTLQERGIHEGIDIFMEYTVRHLLKEGDRVTGCVAYTRVDGDFHAFSAKSVVLATGGITRVWSVCSGSWEYTGDGHALALWSGAELRDMEFVQFHPTGMVWPPSVRGILVTEGVRGEGGRLTNSDGVRFMFDYVPEMFAGDHAETIEESDQWVEEVVSGKLATVRRPPELLTRDVVAKAINSEVKAGRGSPHGGAFLDISHRGEEAILKKLPSMHHQFKELAGVDISKEPMEVGPTAHYVMGGVLVDAETQESTVPGLFACGEVASGLHGANRLGGNSLSDLIVFGKRAGEFAAKRAKDLAQPVIDETQVQQAIEVMLEPFGNKGGENPGLIYDELRDMMQAKVGIIRTKEELDEAIEDLKNFESRRLASYPGSSRKYNSGWHQALDLKNMVDISYAATLAALTREESRGGHTRDDFPVPDDEYWGKTLNIIYMEDGEIKIRQDPVIEMREDLQDAIKEVKQMIAERAAEAGGGN
ncbi:MAG TPA: fumarate reductase/succinate dehydrogenase flavoprotein subunit [Candidatus Poseidoniaceae archaeon]|nr:MAG TPA: fumarate reductase/succinate dehydrogenase flavoprotein subunit [Candidatus Poseidoniales archaeon]DAC61217.1 MAG TPA: fumarate reductase/succinate dehydrogenase flavoprotein subunit [Candidatus Poseidoniales archaeon]HII23146.1 fumarate reductase/succinate dehydrogenase flavoprotein subunit [Candidatus Poseidoniaceae archaeon]HII49897.1 fumarate reductase/succinate dehydrogenase flavoprotein subunit [Candidatus Poseidoniaceae archaeon]|tara:strand:- start:554 stop:2407 length:1854 start_codon:yes stop_codon:yes gene_type:complete